MKRALFPFTVVPSNAVRSALGRDLDEAVVLALRAILRETRSLEVAHQQISYRGHCLAFSSRITGRGDLVLDIDMGDPRLADRLILETELRSAQRLSQQTAGIARDGQRPRKW